MKSGDDPRRQFLRKFYDFLFINGLKVGSPGNTLILPSLSIPPPEKNHLFTKMSELNTDRK